MGYGKTVEIRHTGYPTCQHLEEVRPRGKFLNGKETHTHTTQLKKHKGKSGILSLTHCFRHFSESDHSAVSLVYILKQSKEAQMCSLFDSNSII